MENTRAGSLMGNRHFPGINASMLLEVC